MLLYVGRHCLHVRRPSAAPTSAAGNCVTTRFAIPGSIGCAARACWVSRPHCEHRLRGLAVARSSSVRARVLWHSHLFEHIARDGQVGTRSHLLGFRRSPRGDPRMTRDWRRGGGSGGGSGGRGGIHPHIPPMQYGTQPFIQLHAASLKEITQRTRRCASTKGSLLEQRKSELDASARLVAQRVNARYLFRDQWRLRLLSCVEQRHQFKKPGSRCHPPASPR